MDGWMGQYMDGCMGGWMDTWVDIMHAHTFSTWMTE